MKTSYGYSGNPKNTNRLLHYYYENGRSGYLPEQKKANYDNSLKPDTKYQCPMKCEGEKIYNKSGKCPLCSMQMMPADCGYIFY